MIKHQLLLKYKDKYICSKEDNEYDFIQVPNYFYVEDVASEWGNISIFLSLLLSGNITNQYESLYEQKYFDWEETFNLCDFNCMQPIDENICLYDIDKFIKENPDISFPFFESTLERLSNRLALTTLAELEMIEKKWLEYRNKNENIEDASFGYVFIPRISPDLLGYLRSRHHTNKEHTALLLYSGGKDSTLSAIRLRKMGYYVHFLHFNNGFMRDADKPYLTYKRTFHLLRGYQFPYEFSNIDIKKYFMDYFSVWKKSHGNILEHGTIDSEIRCLSCRLAMYTKAFSIAKKGNYKVLAEGARISQKFMLEQIPMIERLKELGRELNIEVLFPVLDLEDDEKQKEELISSGFSAKSWESKCLLGRTAMDKSPEDEKIILDYYDTIIKPKILKNVKY